MAVKLTVSMFDPISTHISSLFSCIFIIINDMVYYLTDYYITRVGACMGPPHRYYVGAWGPHTILLNRAPTSVNPVLPPTPTRLDTHPGSVQAFDHFSFKKVRSIFSGGDSFSINGQI